MKKYITAFLLMFSLISFSCPNDEGLPTNCGNEEVYITRSTYSEANELSKKINHHDYKAFLNTAMDALIKTSAIRLKRYGYKKEANALLNEWQNTYYGMVFLSSRDLGDHPPLSVWLNTKLTEMLILLGESTMKATRLWDLYVFNLAIPVVVACVDDVDLEEYALHFIPLSAVASFWVSYGACSGLTFGTGALLPLVCAPAAMGVEWVTSSFVAPNLNSSFWGLVCRS